MPASQPFPRVAPISTISTISRPPEGVVEMGARRGARIAISERPRRRNLLVPTLPRGDDPSDAPASTFSSPSGPPECANRVCQPYPSGSGTLWGLRGHNAALQTQSLAITIYLSMLYVTWTGCLPDAAARKATPERQARPGSTFCRLSTVHCPRSTLHCLLSTVHCLLPTAHCPLRGPSSCSPAPETGLTFPRGKPILTPAVACRQDGGGTRPYRQRPAGIPHRTLTPPPRASSMQS